MKEIGTIGAGLPGLVIVEDGDMCNLDELNQRLHCAIDEARTRERFQENEEKGYVVGSCWRTGNEGDSIVEYQKITYINEDGSPNAITITKRSNGAVEINLDTYLFTRWNEPVKMSDQEWNAVLEDVYAVLEDV